MNVVLSTSMNVFRNCHIPMFTILVLHESLWPYALDKIP